MQEAIAALPIFDRLLSVLGLIRESNRLAENRKDEALQKIYAALLATQSYLKEREAGADRNVPREYSIAELWHTASIPLRHIDKEFALLCLQKGGYWMQPDTWSEEAVKAKGIKIEQVMEYTRRLLADNG